MVTLISCASTKPNIPYAGKSYPPSLNYIAQKYPQLVMDLGKLPELQDGISADEASTLKQITELYKKNPIAFYEIFLEMYEVGLPNTRKYCSPLQALFWLVEDGKIFTAKKILENYSLEYLLEEAWEFNDWERWNDFNRVVDRLNAPKLFVFYMNADNRYKWDLMFGHLQNPEKTIKSRKGDCLAFAAAAHYSLSRAGVKGYFLSMDYFNTSGHSVYVQVINKELWTIDNTRGIDGPFQSDKEINKSFGYTNSISIKENWVELTSRFR